MSIPALTMLPPVTSLLLLARVNFDDGYKLAGLIAVS